MAKRRKKKGKGKSASRAYEAALSTPLRRAPIGAHLSQDSATERALPQLRDWGRYLDENHDLASGVLDEICLGVVGSGILTIPKPLRTDGSVDEVLGRQLMEEWKRWTRTCDVTGELSWHEAQRLICRAKFRDGESFYQHVQGRERGYPFSRAEVPYRLEILEAEMVPHDLIRDGWRQGIRHDTWRRPVSYAVYLAHPGDTGFMAAGFTSMAIVSDDSFKQVPAEQMGHVKLAKRWPATRGVTIFAPVISRLYDIKDLEESERLKNRVLSSWCAAIIKNPDIIGTEDTDERGNRYLQMASATIIDSLAPGETIDGVGPDYPVANMPDHIADQIKRVSVGTGTRNSSISRNYNGTYASQRQEMVESERAYKARFDSFIAEVCKPVYERWVTTAALSGFISVPPGMDLMRLANAEYRGPVTPWIDPLKEVQADALAVKEGFASLEQIQIKRGMDADKIGQRPAQQSQPAQLELIPSEDEEEAA